MRGIEERKGQKEEGIDLRERDEKLERRKERWE